MTPQIGEFHGVFFEESFEAIDAMEAALLALDPGAPNAEAINSVFRVAHSIKGGSGMFGFTAVTSFTHTLETLLDELRGGRMQVSSAIIDLLLKSGDTLRGMLKATQQNTAIDEQAVADVQFDLEQLVARVANNGAADAAAPSDPTAAPRAATASAPAKSVSARHGVWRIALRPTPRLLLHGNDPLRMLAELRALGELACELDASQVPPLQDLDPEICYFRWTLRLSTDAPLSAVRNVFEWADGDCEIDIAELSGEQPVPAPAELAATTAVSVAAPAPAAEPRSVNVAESTTDKGARPPSSDATSIRVAIEKIDELMNTVGEIVITQSMLMQFAHDAQSLQLDQLRNGLTQLERNVRELQESVMRVRMLPISFAFSRFPRLVRDLSLRLGKKIELRMTGEQTELDKTVLEKIGDPLVHLVRNSIDHGIESPETRRAAGKPETGTVFLHAFHRGGAIVIEVGDDGAGLNYERILAKARAQGLVAEHDVLSPDAIANLIFLPGFSTAEHTTELSGRGVGMDVVRRNIKELGGTAELHSGPGQGSRVVITLPLTLAIVDGQSVSVGSEVYIVPLVTIVESLQLKPGNVNRLVGRGEVFSFRGEYIPIIRLHQLFGATPRHAELHQGLIMVVEGDGRKVGLFVDELLGQQQVVIKSMETNYRQVQGISGATILGEGSVALILDVPGLVRFAGERLAA